MKKLTIWNIVTLLFSLCCLLLLYSKGCPNTPFYFPDITSDDARVPADCSTCQISRSLQIQSPEHFIVCTEDQRFMFRSPCRAGCEQNDVTNSTQFSNCHCAEMATNQSSVVTAGRCPASQECGGYFYLFGFMLVFFPCLLATGPFGVSKYLTIMRSVEDRDKEVAIMLAQVGGQLLALIPSPPFFGFLLDNSCIHKRHEEDAVCNMYDKDLMKRDFYLGVAILVFVVLLLEVLIYWHSHDIQLYVDPDSEPDNGKENRQEEKHEESI